MLWREPGSCCAETRRETQICLYISFSPCRSQACSHLQDNSGRTFIPHGNKMRTPQAGALLWPRFPQLIKEENFSPCIHGRR